MNDNTDIDIARDGEWDQLREISLEATLGTDGSIIWTPTGTHGRTFKQAKKDAWIDEAKDGAIDI